jgi:hypothetical protein
MTLGEQASSYSVKHALQQGLRCRSRYPALCPRVHSVRLAKGLLTLAPVATQLAVASSPSPNVPLRPATPQEPPAQLECVLLSLRASDGLRPRRLAPRRCHAAAARAPSPGAASSFARSHARRLCSFSKASAAFRSATSSLPRLEGFCALRPRDLRPDFFEPRSPARSVGCSACSLKGPLEPTGRFRTTPGTAMVAAITSGSSLCLAASW